MRDILTWSLVLSGIRLSTPLLFAAMGGLVSERSGVINIALEGQMLAGAFIGVAVTWWTGSLWLGFGSVLLLGAAMGLLHAWFSVSLRANQIVAATAWNLLAAGLTAVLIGVVWGRPGASPSVPTLQPIFLDLTILDWIGLALAPVLWVVLYRTPAGLRLRACGEDPHATATVGVDVARLRYVAVTISATLAALGGAYLSLVQVGLFQRNMAQGRGFIALGALIFGKWKPAYVFGACLLFGFADAFQFHAQATGVDLPHELLLAFPYVLALAALATFVDARQHRRRSGSRT